jgi:hypothetical protein
MKLEESPKILCVGSATRYSETVGLVPSIELGLLVVSVEKHIIFEKRRKSSNVCAFLQ